MLATVGFQASKHLGGGGGAEFRHAFRSSRGTCGYWDGTTTRLTKCKEQELHPRSSKEHFRCRFPSPRCRRRQPGCPALGAVALLHDCLHMSLVQYEGWAQHTSSKANFFLRFGWGSFVAQLPHRWLTRPVGLLPLRSAEPWCCLQLVLHHPLQADASRATGALTFFTSGNPGSLAGQYS